MSVLPKQVLSIAHTNMLGCLLLWRLNWDGMTRGAAVLSNPDLGWRDTLSCWNVVASAWRASQSESRRIDFDPAHPLP